MLESKFQHSLIRDIKRRFPKAIVMKNDASYIQGIPDLTVLNGSRWAMLECKASATSSVRPNQRHYVEKLNRMGFAAFIYPENKEEVLDAMARSFQRGNNR